MQNRGWKSIISYLHNLPVIANLEWCQRFVITVQKSMINALACRFSWSTHAPVITHALKSKFSIVLRYDGSMPLFCRLPTHWPMHLPLNDGKCENIAKGLCDSDFVMR